MKYTVQEIANRFRSIIGDETLDIPMDFIINSINYCFSELPRVPKLERLFYQHITVELDAKDHYKWEISGKFRRLNNTIFMNFWTSTGGDICRLPICHRDIEMFYNKHGIPKLKKPGVPCEYTLEQEDDNIYLVLDRPSDVPIMLDYGATGFPKPVSKPEDVVEISAIAENLMFAVMKNVYYQESADFAFAADIENYLDNKLVPEAVQLLNKRWNTEAPVILGEQ